MSDDGGHHDDSFNNRAPQYLKKLERAVFRIRGLSRAEAEDIIQTAFLRLLEAMRQRHIDNVDAYLAKIVSNLLNDLWKLRGREKAVPYDDENTLREVEEKGAETDDSATRLLNEIYYEQVINSLPAAIRAGLDRYDFKLIKLRVLEELSFGEVAELVGKSEAEVHFHFDRLLAKLRYRVRKYFGDGDGPF